MRDWRTTVVGAGGAVLVYLISSLLPEAVNLQNISISAFLGFLGIVSKDSKK